MTTLTETLIAIPCMAAVILATSAFPFLLFSRKDPPPALRFVERFIPPMVMGVLVVYCLKEVKWTIWPSGLGELAGLAAVTVLHVWKKNAMISIFGGTAVYMALQTFLK